MTRPRRVVLIHDAYFDYVAGLANALADHLEVCVIGPSRWSDVAEEYFRPDVAVVPFESRRLRDPRRGAAVASVMRTLGRLRPDVVHVQQTGDPWLNLALSMAHPEAPVVQTVHDVAPHPGDDSQPRGVAGLQRRLAPRSDRFVAHTPMLARRLAQTWRIDPTRIDVVPHGELGSLYRAALDAGRPRAAREGATVLFFGRRWAYKGLTDLVDALALLAAGRDDLRLVVAGTGESPDPDLARLPRNVIVERHDRYTSTEETVDLFDRATVVCLPYREASQSGVAALAIGLGTPVVATSVGGLPDLARPDREAIVVAPRAPLELAAALGRVLDDRALQRSLSTASLERAAGELSWAAAASATLQVYASAVAT